MLVCMPRGRPIWQVASITVVVKVCKKWELLIGITFSAAVPRTEFDTVNILDIV